ncbi:hypothetical protein AB434_0502 [Heyndrickxia coagulans]|nr:hypothetical protein AB434_0502 [Heyndrickxia coagulans]
MPLKKKPGGYPGTRFCSLNLIQKTSTRLARATSERDMKPIA